MSGVGDRWAGGRGVVSGVEVSDEWCGSEWRAVSGVGDPRSDAMNT